MKSPLHILMIDDDSEDQFFVQSLFRELNIHLGIDFISESTQVFPYLDEAAAADRLPSLITLDKNLPAIEGYELLLELKRHPLYRMIPVVIVSGTAFPEEVRKFYAAGASSFVQKPFTQRESAEKIACFIKYYFEVCQLPSLANVVA